MEGITLVGIIILWLLWYYIRKVISFKQSLFYCLIFVISFPILFLAPLYIYKNKIGKWDIGLVGTRIPHLLTTKEKDVFEDFKKSIENVGTISKMSSGCGTYIFCGKRSLNFSIPTMLCLSFFFWWALSEEKSYRIVQEKFLCLFGGFVFL